MTLFQSLIYGLVQGLTEFLPVSSSAHLLLLPIFTGWKDPGLDFDVALHWGTLLAVTFYFRQEIAQMAWGFIGWFQGGRAFDNKLPWLIVLATIPAAIAGALIEQQAKTVFRSPWVTVATLSVVACLLLWADRTGQKSVTLNEMTWREALIIGLTQACALIPGVSRSGITITTALFLGFSRTAAVQFSFLLSIPITFAAGVHQAGFLVKHAASPVLWTGLLSSFLSGCFAIHLLLTYVKNKSFLPFIAYRIVLALGLVGWLLLKK